MGFLDAINGPIAGALSPQAGGTLGQLGLPPEEIGRMFEALRGPDSEQALTALRESLAGASIGGEHADLLLAEIAQALGNAGDTMPEHGASHAATAGVTEGEPAPGWFTTGQADAGIGGEHGGPAPIEATADHVSGAPAVDAAATMESLAPVMNQMIEVLRAEQEMQMRTINNLRAEAPLPGAENLEVAVVVDASASAALATDASATTDPHTDHGSPGSGYKDHSLAEDHTVEANIADHDTVSEGLADVVVPDADAHSGETATDHVADAVTDHAADAVADAHATDTSYHSADTGETASA